MAMGIFSPFHVPARHKDIVLYALLSGEKTTMKDTDKI